MTYDFQSIETKWQQRWAERETFRVPNPSDDGFDPDRPKFYVLDMFPYPSGVGLHVGHPLGFIATDIVGRYKRAHGFNVLHPMGFDAFGLPAEQYAIETGVHPRITTEKNIATMVEQLKRLGMAYDWGRTFATTDPGYVKWTQWIFLQLFDSYYDPIEDAARPIETLVAKLQGEEFYVGMDGELITSGSDEDLEAITGGRVGVHKWRELEPDQQRRLLDEYRLAYLADVEVNWCPALGTVLANEEVTADGRSERGNHPVVKRPLKQWMLRITAYADRLIEDLDGVNWPEPIRLLQRNWIGKSLGAEVDFEIAPLAPGSAGGSDAGDSDESPVKQPPAEPGANGESIRVFTTRPDTLFGATYLVLAPEHELVDFVTTVDQRNAVEQYKREAAAKSSVERQAGGGAKDKTGVFTGAYALNPVNGERLPIWVADYVMMGYGTGVIMAVPAHDERDHAFATKFNLTIVEVVQAPPGYDVQEAAWTGDGALVNSTNDDMTLNGKPVAAAKQLISEWLERKGSGRGKVQYRLRDWLFSRQRYWGEPFPILHGPDGELRAVDAADLPVELPEMEDFKPTPGSDPDAPPRPPLGRAPASWREVIIEGVKWTRELNTMPNWAGSCWYYLRYLDPGNTERFVGEEAERYWMAGKSDVGSRKSDPVPALEIQVRTSDCPQGVDLYVGGVEHAVLHLLYARFWHKVLYDLGHVSTPEPFGRLFSQGYIQAYCYRDERGIAVPAAEVVNQDGRPAAEVQGSQDQQYTYDGEPVSEEFGKMGKSLKNAIAPDEIIEKYGCDTLRLYEMYLGPLDQSKIWSTADIVGVHRFLKRLWRNFVDEDTGALLVDRHEPPVELDRLTHRTIKRVTEAMEAMQFNVAIAALIELNNALVARDTVPEFTATALVQMLAPLAPHVAEELWELLGHGAPGGGGGGGGGSIADAGWPLYSEAKLVEVMVEVPVQVNGKMRGKVTVAADADAKALEAAAKADANVAAHLEGQTIRKVIIIPGRLVNLVVS